MVMHKTYNITARTASQLADHALTCNNRVTVAQLSLRGIQCCLSCLSELFLLVQGGFGGCHVPLQDIHVSQLGYLICFQSCCNALLGDQLQQASASHSAHRNDTDTQIDDAAQLMMRQGHAADTLSAEVVQVYLNIDCQELYLQA